LYYVFEVLHNQKRRVKKDSLVGGKLHVCGREVPFDPPEEAFPPAKECTSKKRRSVQIRKCM
jgi:hypothetical protein